MKISSWNVNSVRARILNVIDYLKRDKPDILFLQEIKTENINFPTDEFKKIGFAQTVKHTMVNHGNSRNINIFQSTSQLNINIKHSIFTLNKDQSKQ